MQGVRRHRIPGRAAVMEIMPVDNVAHLIEAGACPTSWLRRRARWACAPCGERTRPGLAGDDSLDEVVVLGERSQEDEEESLAAAAAVVTAATASAPAAPAVPAAVRVVVAAENSEAVILIADDDPQMRRLVRSILERDGYEVTEAADGLDALDQVEGKSFDLMVLDVDMPRPTGSGCWRSFAPG